MLYVCRFTNYNVSVETQKLQELNIEAWTYLLRRERDMLDVQVLDVAAEKLSANITRYLLTLAKHPEPIALIGKTTTAAEVHFYDEYAKQLSNMVNRCWFSQQMGKDGWLVLDVPDDHHPPHTWSIQDVENIIEHLALLHSTFWAEDMLLAGLPNYIGRNEEDDKRSTRSGGRKQKAIYRRTGRRVGLPASYLNFDLQLVGVQASALMKATVGLQILRGLGGWPGVLSDKHLDAFEALLEQPDLMMKPLRQVPFTLMHSRPSISNWNIGIFDSVALLDWQHISYGPGICDLIYFIEDFYIHCTGRNVDEKRSYYLYREWPIVEETLIDSYFIRLAQELEADEYSARQMRRYALPAARCLYVLTYWLPTISEWFMHLPSSNRTWNKIQEMDDNELASLGYTPLVGLRPHLQKVFARFLDAYNLLWM